MTVPTGQEYEIYRKKFKDYPDVVDTSIFCKMLENKITETTAEKMFRQNRVRHFKIGKNYQIPKEWIIEYMLSPAYEKDRRNYRPKRGPRQKPSRS